MKKLLLLLVVLFQAGFAQNFNFASSGTDSANIILKNYIQKEYNIEDIDTVAYFYDSKVIGIVKHGAFYNLEGYKLIVLDKTNNEYTPIKCDVYFDNTKEVLIENNKITFYKSYFYKNKKYKAAIKSNEITTHKFLNDIVADKKVRNIEQTIAHKKNDKINNIELSDFNINSQKNVVIKYNNLNDKTKHYLDMK